MGQTPTGSVPATRRRELGNELDPVVGSRELAIGCDEDGFGGLGEDDVGGVVDGQLELQAAHEGRRDQIASRSRGKRQIEATRDELGRDSGAHSAGSYVHPQSVRDFDVEMLGHSAADFAGVHRCNPETRHVPFLDRRSKERARVKDDRRAHGPGE